MSDIMFDYIFSYIIIACLALIIILLSKILIAIEHLIELTNYTNKSIKLMREAYNRAKISESDTK